MMHRFGILNIATKCQQYNLRVIVNDIYLGTLQKKLAIIAF